MRILMLGDSGTEHVQRWSAHFRRKGDDVLVASAQTSGATDVRLQLPLRWPALGYPMLVPVLKRLADEFKPDVTVAHYLPNYGLLTVLADLRPRLLLAWGSDLLVLPNRGPLQRARLSYVARRGGTFLVDARMLVEPLAQLGAPVERVYVCPFGVDEDVLALGEHVSRPRAEFPVLLSNRSLEPAYRNQVLVEALGELRANNQSFNVIIANDGTQREKLQRLCHYVGVSNRVRFTGFLERDDYLTCLGQSDIYVATSPSDSTSVSLLEAMAAGHACVVPDIPGNREWIRDGHNGVLYPSKDAGQLAAALGTLINHPERAATLGTRARAVVKARGRWAHTVRVAESLLGELTGEAPCGGS
jgi:glycosyltransferase involved in cell wall biosynthesis